MKNLLFLFLALSFYNCKAQSADQKESVHKGMAIKSIRFSNDAANVIGDEVEISIYPSRKNAFAILSIHAYRRESRHQISIEEYDAICESLLKIQPKDIIEEFKMMLDGSITEINFGEGTSRVQYSVAGLDSEDDKTNYKDFLFSTRLILESAKIKIAGINQ